MVCFKPGKHVTMLCYSHHSDGGTRIDTEELIHIPYRLKSADLIKREAVN